MAFIDEVDSKENESWPYEAMLASLEAGPGKVRHVFVIAGSSGADLQKMKERIAARPKGKDLLSRIPIGNEYSVPGMSLLDNIFVFLSCLSDAASHTGKRIDEVEKLGLYYVATSSNLGNPRKLREFALRCAERVPVGDERLKYDGMFEAGDLVNKEFWAGYSKSLPKLVNSFLQFEVPVSDRPQARVPKAAAPSKEKVAVLPLVSMSPDPNDEYFADGMTEELISSVSRTQGLKVIARTSVMRYKGTTKSISEIGKELGVGNVIEGSVRKAGDKVRITVQLVDTSNEEAKWSQGYDREITDVLSLQDDISRKVAEALRMQVLGPTAAEGPPLRRGISRLPERKAGLEQADAGGAGTGCHVIPEIASSGHRLRQGVHGTRRQLLDAGTPRIRRTQGSLPEGEGGRREGARAQPSVG